MSISNIKDTLNHLKSISSNNTRKDELQKIITNQPDVHNVLIFLLNDFKKTNIAKAKIAKDLSETEPEIDLNNFSEFLEYLNEKVSGKDSAVKAIQQFIAKQDPDNQEFLAELATKSYKTHVSKSTYNKIANDLNIEKIPDFKVQTAHNITDIEPRLEKKPDLLGHFSITEKFDGVRCIAFLKNGKVTLMTRQGKTIEQVTEITSELSAWPYPEHVFDGELLVSDEILNASSDELKAEDAFRLTMKIVGSKTEKLGLQYHIFDELNSVSRFLENEASRQYQVRRQELTRIQTELTTGNFPSSPHIKIVPTLYDGTDTSFIELWKNTITSQGGEGVMINKSDALYEFKRSFNLLKVKQISENDGIIKGVYEGSGEIAGQLGGIQITYKDTIVNIGNGFTAQERIDYWKHPEKIIGKIGTFKFTTESQNEKGEHDLRFARWKGLRLDKTQADTSYDN